MESDGPLLTSELTVELQPLEQSRMRAETRVGGDGSFAFDGIAAGHYKLRVIGPAGALLREQIVDVGAGAPLAVRLPAARTERPVAGTVSVARLRHPVPGKAERKFAEAQWESDNRRYAQAACKLEEALRIFPEYYEARSNLGVQYMRMGRREDALREFELAARGEPSALVLSNLSYAYLESGRWEEAGNAARRAVDLDPAAYLAHYLLGITLAAGDKLDEAEKHFVLGARANPAARVALAKLYFSRSKSAAAERELELYLKSGDKRFRDQVEQWFRSPARSRGLPAAAE